MTDWQPEAWVLDVLKNMPKFKVGDLVTYRDRAEFGEWGTKGLILEVKPDPGTFYPTGDPRPGEVIVLWLDGADEGERCAHWPGNLVHLTNA